ncbi:hypothetical protein Agub_g11494, partial [Astrephomene gubernaculifera]
MPRNVKLRSARGLRMPGLNVATGLVAAAATVGALLVASKWFLRNTSIRPKPVVIAGGQQHQAPVDGPATDAPPDGGPVSQEARQLAALYGKMADDFAAQDLNHAAIEPLKSWFHGLESPSDTPWPKKYTELDPPLQFGAIRLLVVPLDDSPAVLRIAAAVTADVMRRLPQGTKVFANARGNYHCTVFHTSQPTDPRPDPTRPDGGTDLSLAPHLRRLPTAAEWERELEAVRRLVAETPVPVLRLERVVQASSGVLLLTWTEVGEGAAISGLRHRLRETFPGASTKQATIIHSSLLRIVSSEPLGRAAVEEVSAACQRWTERLRGTLYRPKTLWFIRETEFSTVVGDREVLTLADASAP